MGIPLRILGVDWIAAARFALLVLVVAVAYELLGRVSGLPTQGAIVLIALSAIAAAMWWPRPSEVADANSEGPSAPRVRPLGDLRFYIFFSLFYGAQAVYGLSAYEVGDRRWWLAVLGIPFCGGSLLYCLVDLYRGRQGMVAGSTVDAS